MDPLVSLKEPSLKQPTIENLQPSFKFLSFTTPNSTNSKPPSNRTSSKKKVEDESVEQSSRIRIVTHKLQEIPNSDSCKDEGFKCNALCMYLPGIIGKTKAIKGRKEEAQVRVVNPVLSKPVSSEIFERNSQVMMQGRVHENEGDNSVSSYFDLPSELFKCKNHGA